MLLVLSIESQIILLGQEGRFEIQERHLLALDLLLATEADV